MYLGLLLIIAVFLLLIPIVPWFFLPINKLQKKTYAAISKEEEISLRLEGPVGKDDPLLTQHLLHKVLLPPSNKAYNLSTRRTDYDTSLTWKFIHNKLVTLFKDEPPGFFVEAGAFDGQLLSNTLWLEQQIKWKGLLVEPNRVNFISLQHKNRKAWTALACLSTRPYPKLATMVGFSGHFKKGDFFQNTIDIFLRSTSFDSEIGINVNGPSTNLLQTYDQIQCYQIESFLRALNVTTVDFLSLDIQGGEWEVLKHWPWKEVKLRTIAVEYLISPQQKGILDQNFITFMDRKGYQLIGTSYEPDYFFVLKEDKLSNKISYY